MVQWPMTKLCTIPGCSDPLHSKGLCNKHHQYKFRTKCDVVPLEPVHKKIHILSNVDISSKTAICSNCGPVKVKSRGEGKGWRCAADSSNREKKRKKEIRKIIKPKGPNCEVCGTTKKLCWDHNHKTDEHRGTLCHWCNTSIGLANDDPVRLRALASYLEKHRQ